LIVVDSSALVAIALNEPDRDLLLDTIRVAPAASLSPVNYTETGMVLRQKGFISGQAIYNAWLRSLLVSVRDDMSLGEPAFAAFLAFGKGRHPARLNLGDCFAYALAKALDAPLLYKGDDFARTDVRSAL
jgi:ribonuclease VapC